MKKYLDLANTSHNQIKQPQSFIPYNKQRESTLTATTEHQTPTSLLQSQNNTDFGENWCAAPAKGQKLRNTRNVYTMGAACMPMGIWWERIGYGGNPTSGFCDNGAWRPRPPLLLASFPRRSRCVPYRSQTN